MACSTEPFINSRRISSDRKGDNYLLNMPELKLMPLLEKCCDIKKCNVGRENDALLWRGMYTRQDVQGAILSKMLFFLNKIDKVSSKNHP